MDFAFHHVALTVTDIERSTVFYSAFGMKELSRFEEEDGSMKIVQLKFGEAILELFWFRDHAGLPEHARELAKDLRVIGTKHFGFRVNDLELALEQLKERGIDMVTEPKVGRTGVTYCFFKDPDGILVEVSQDDRL